MIDKTTAGYHAVPDEVEAVLHNLCGYHLSERDALLRYEALTREQVLYDALVSAIRRERGRAVAEIVEAGHKITQVAEMTRLGTRQRVQRLISIAKAAETAAGEAAAVAEAAAAEAEVARGLGAAVIESVRELADDGLSDDRYAPAAGFSDDRYAPAAGFSDDRYAPAAGFSDDYASVGGFSDDVYASAGGSDLGFSGQLSSHAVDPAAVEDRHGYGYGDLPVPHPHTDRSRFDSELIPDPEADPRFAAAEYSDDLDPDAVLEPTMMMPTIVEPTREVKAASDVSWWRRSRDNAARSA